MSKYVFIVDTTNDNQPLAMTVRETDDPIPFAMALLEANADSDHIRYMEVTDDLLHDWTEFEVFYR